MGLLLPLRRLERCLEEDDLLLLPDGSPLSWEDRESNERDEVRRLLLLGFKWRLLFRLLPEEDDLLDDEGLLLGFGDLLVLARS